MLAKIESLLATNQVMSAKQLAKQLVLAPTTLEPMMQLLIKRGKVKQIENKGCSGGCGCTVEAELVYQWQQATKQPTNTVSVMPPVMVLTS